MQSILSIQLAQRTEILCLCTNSMEITRHDTIDDDSNDGVVIAVCNIIVDDSILEIVVIAPEVSQS